MHCNYMPTGKCRVF